MGLLNQLFRSPPAPSELKTTSQPVELLACAKQLYFNLTVPVLLTDLSGNIVFINPALQQLLSANTAVITAKDR